MNEYILNIDKQSFRVYAYNEELAKQTFVSLCNGYLDTDNNKYREHWLSLKELMKDDEYTILKNEDFKGVREIV